MAIRPRPLPGKGVRGDVRQGLVVCSHCFMFGSSWC